MRIFKIFLAILAIPVILAIALIAWIFFSLEILYPLQYKRLQREAAEWNENKWETGYALQVTVQMTSDDSLGGNTAVALIGCFQKRFARSGGLKGPPGSWVIDMSDGPQYLSIPFGPDATHNTELRDLCREVINESDGWQFPHVPNSYDRHDSHILANDQSFSCRLGSDLGTSRGAVSYLTVLGLGRVPLRELISLEAYNALPEPDYSRPRPLVPTYAWRARGEEAECWRGGQNGACFPEALATCGRPVR